MQRILLRYRYWPVPVVVWTMLVVASWLWNQALVEHKLMHLAQDRAEFVFKMVETARLWNARHGGVYAAIDERTPPNPYLKVPEREITTPSGVELTMVNPAYMTRQLIEVVAERTDLRLHLTSLKPLNPKNQADAWEAVQLEKFTRGAGEVLETVREEGGERFRFMAPLKVEEPCMKCHRHQGYQIGDIRGGLSVSFPAPPLRAQEAVQLRRIGMMHLIVWALVSALILFGLVRFRRHLFELETAKAQTELLVQERTAELREQVLERQQAEAQLRLFIESSGEGILGMDLRGRCTLANPEAVRLLRAQPEQLLGKDLPALIHARHSDGTPHSAQSCALHRTLQDGQAVHDDSDVFWRMDGTSIPVEYRSHPLYADGYLLGAVVTFSDISQRRAAEATLRKLSSAIEHSPAAAVITDRQGLIEYVNPRFSEMTGFDAADVLGQNPRIWQSGLTPLKTYQRLWATINAGELWEGEWQNKTRQGQVFWARARISPIRSEDGEITHFVLLMEDISAHKAQEETIWHQANYDSLTGLPNRTLFAQRLNQALTQAERNNAQSGLFYIDLDGFKAVNDNLGHAAGDLLLQEVARRLLACVRDSDTVARLGGDEFAVILSQVSGRGGAVHVAQNILRSLQVAFLLGEDAAHVSASIGIAFYPEHAATADALMRAADAAMYAVKAAGKGDYRFADAADGSGGTAC
ncbi:diguanylate cyclase domain-containing protein [Azonexus sp.]|uniref:diguanylate cyclase domain-containing protein n=1 Tax=Azonexus sp. TaxID=1872668 RepID=UPI0039E33C19